MKITFSQEDFCLPVKSAKKVFFYWWKQLFPEPSYWTSKWSCLVCWQEKDVDKSRLVVKRAKFVSHVMLSAGVCYGG